MPRCDNPIRVKIKLDMPEGMPASGPAWARVGRMRVFIPESVAGAIRRMGTDSDTFMAQLVPNTWFKQKKTPFKAIYVEEPEP